jgi:cell fate (sporulation/competence/biofilm development) regulator YlbF (YheA/YmcA/DUF963 family)
MGILPMFAVHRDIDRYPDRFSPSAAIPFSRPTEDRFALASWLEYQPTPRNTAATGTDARATGRWTRVKRRTCALARWPRRLHDGAVDLTRKTPMPVDNQQVLDEAQKLARLVARHPAVEKYKQAQKSVAEDADAARLLGEFDRQIQRLAQQQQTGMPITDAQHQQIEALQGRIASHIKVKALNMAQVEYTDLRRRIGQMIDQAVQEEAGGAAAAPGAPASSGPRITM